MIGNAEEFNQALGIPYRIVNIVSGKQCQRNVYLLCKLLKQAVFEDFMELLLAVVGGGGGWCVGGRDGK